MDTKYTGAGIVEVITARMKKMYTGDIIVLGVATLLAIVSEDMRQIIVDIADSAIGAVIIAFFVAVAIWDVWYLLKLKSIRNCVEQCWVKVERDKVVGYTAEALDDPQNARYFEIPMEDIRSVDSLTIDLFQRQFYTLRINHKNGTVKIPVDESGRLVHYIEDAIQKATNVQ